MQISQSGKSASQVFRIFIVRGYSKIGFWSGPSILFSWHTVEERQKWIGSPLYSHIDSLRPQSLTFSVDKIHIELYIEIEFSCSQGKLYPIIILYISLWIFVLTFYNVVILKTDVICKCLTLSLGNVFELNVFVNTETYCDNLLLLKQNIFCKILNIRKSCF